MPSYTAAQTAPTASVQELPCRRKMGCEAARNSFVVCSKVTKTPCAFCLQGARFGNTVAPAWSNIFWHLGKVRQVAASPHRARGRLHGHVRGAEGSRRWVLVTFPLSIQVWTDAFPPPSSKASVWWGMSANSESFFPHEGLKLPVIEIFSLVKVYGLRHSAHHVLHFRALTGNNCWCMMQWYIFNSPVQVCICARILSTISPTAHRRCAACYKSNKFVPGQLHISHDLTYVLKKMSSFLVLVACMDLISSTFWTQGHRLPSSCSSSETPPGWLGSLSLLNNFCWKSSLTLLLSVSSALHSGFAAPAVLSCSVVDYIP